MLMSLISTQHIFSNLHSVFPTLEIHFVIVEQGIHELRKLGIEQLLWEFSRQEVNGAKGELSDTNGELSDAEDDLT